jgi:lipoprotein-anchoring transpeptidase ErfK/SrfK
MVRRLLLAVFIVVVVAAAFLSVQVVYADSTYFVEPGDTLFRIALNHGLTTQQLAEANGIINPSMIYAGQALTIPDGSSSPEAEAASISHLVEPGETLFRIAVRYGLSTQSIAQANDITNYDLVFAGQYLTIPQSGSAADTDAQPESTAASAPPSNVNAAPGEHWIDVNLTTQSLTAYEGDQPVLTTNISSGAWPHLTVTGQFQVYIRYQSQDMNGLRLGYDYYLENVPYVMYFYKDYALHGTYWHNNFGFPMSHGCVNMKTADAQWLFNWSSYGTVVNVHY